MTYSLKKPDDTVVELPGDASITARPLTTPVLEAAKAVASRLSREAKDSPEMLQTMNLIAADGADENIGQKLYELFLHIELGIRLIVSWQGFDIDEDGQAAEPTPDNIRTVFCFFPLVPKMFFDAVAVGPLRRLVVKKNSASAAAGTSSVAADSSTAEDAGK